MSTVVLIAAAGLLTGTTAMAEIANRAVAFESQGQTLAGTLYLPPGFDGTPTDAVVATGAWISVKEQMPATYARAMAERGLIAVTFDFRGWGKSGDLPGGQRFVEVPAAKTADIRAVIDQLVDRPEVAAIRGLGVCASAGYMLDAARGNDRVASVGLVAPSLQDRAIVEAVYGGPEGVAGLMRLAAEAEAQGGQVIPAAGPEGAERVPMPIGGYHFEPSRGAIPAYDNAWNDAGWDDWLTYHPLDGAASFDKPLAIVHSDATAIPQGVRAFVERMAGEATQRWLEDVTQFGFYDCPDAVARAADTIAAHVLANAADTLPQAGDSDTACVATLVSSIPLAVDRAAYDLAEAAFAPEIVVDYTSLWGGELTTMTPAALMDAWRGIVPGFDATWHELGPVAVEIRGNAATATASVDGCHWIDDRLWRPVGTYHWDLARLGGNWRVIRMVFKLTEEIGERALAREAMGRPAAG